MRMPDENEQIAASHVLEGVVRHGTTDSLTLGEILTSLHERGFAFLMLIFVLPNCVPVPIPPGMSSIFALPILFLSVQMIIGQEAPWLPEWLKQKSIKRSTLALMIERIAPRLRRLEKVLRPRLYRGDPRKTEKVYGFICLLFGLSIAVPLPMTNFLPGIGIMMMSLGMLSRDGLISILGFTIGSFGVTITFAILLLGKGAVMTMFGMTDEVE